MPTTKTSRPKSSKPVEKKHISILKRIKGKPSVALQYMVDGLLKQSKRKNFKIYMTTFGDFEASSLVMRGQKRVVKPMCFGCAATCSIQEIARKNFTVRSNGKINNKITRAQYLNFDFSELDKFESAINQARLGNMVELFYFCLGENNPDFEYGGKYNCVNLHPNFNLDTNDWKEQLPEVRKYIKLLKKHNL